MSNTKVQTLIETIELSQKLLIYYVSLMKEEDETKVFEVEGTKLNSLYWIVGHLAWAENMLLLKGTHGIESKHGPLDQFKFGEKHAIDEKVSFKELKQIAREIHEESMAHLHTLTDEDLAKKNALNFGFGQEPNYQVILMHFIRHLGTHVGHLSWLCKLYGVKSV